MAFKGNQNITTALTAELVAPGENVTIESVALTNVHASDSVTVNLYKETKNNKIYIVKNLVIPYGVTLLLDSDHVKFFTGRSVSLGAGLYIKLSASDSAVDVIIKRKI